MNYFNEAVKDEFPNIPFNKIDEEMHDIVYLFNKIGLKTLYCCSGHGHNTPYIMLNPEIDHRMVFFIWDMMHTSIRMESDYWVRDTSLGVLKNWIFHFTNMEEVNKATEVFALYYSIPKGD